ncbi:MAG TPA: Hsp20/alpha crystallin family protein, partial [Polyangiaceae bacterium]|nr:Hsp20/alpha crystallin family protein [Polyangiaceae bacterium]
MSNIQNDQAPQNGAPSAEAAPARAESAFWHATPELDVYESESAYLIHLNVAGASTESVNVQVIGAEVQVRAEQAPVAGRSDVALALYQRRFELPSDVDAASASAQLRDGVLEIRIQKSAAAR